MHRSCVIPGLLLLLAGCGESQPEPPPAPSAPAGPIDLPGVEHDFGTIPHGEIRTHTFDLSIPGGGVGFTPVGFTSGCSCGRAQYQIVQADGTLRQLAGLPFSEHTLREGERLQLVITIDTNLKEPADLATVTMHGVASIQDIPSRKPQLTMPVVFRFAIDAPIEVRPIPHIDFGELPQSRPYSQIMELHPDGGKAVQFGPVATSDPRLTAKLREEDGVTLLDVRFEPGPDAIAGPVRMAIQVGTDLNENYALSIAVSGALIPDITVQPYARIGFGHVDFAAPTEKFVTIQDHNLQREPTFVVTSITDPNGLPLDEHFDYRLEALPGRPRATKVVLRYLGKLEGRSFRGVLKLAKPDGGNATRIDFVGFNSKS